MFANEARTASLRPFVLLACLHSSSSVLCPAVVPCGRPPPRRQPPLTLVLLPPLPPPAGAGLLPAAHAHWPAPRLPPVYHRDPRGCASCVRLRLPGCKSLRRLCRLLATSLPAAGPGSPSALTLHLPRPLLTARRACGLRDGPLHPLPRVAGSAGGAWVAPPLWRAQHGAMGVPPRVGQRTRAGSALHASLPTLTDLAARPLTLSHSCCWQVRHHDYHHRYPRHHFSLYMTHWDRWCGTEHPHYAADVAAHHAD